jgi:secreted trypsin-like serine protease
LTASVIACGKMHVNPTQDQTLDNSSADSIIGGSLSTDDFQKQSGIVGLLLVIQDQSGQQGSAICTGSLIAENVVLTAAHCLAINPGEKIINALIFFDKNLDHVMEQISKKDFSKVRSINKVIRHKSYLTEKGANNDLALARFAGKAPSDFQIAKMASPSLERSLRSGTNVMLSGYGVSSYGLTGPGGQPDGDGDGILRQVDGIRLVSFINSGKELLFDQTKGKGACHGDSGGPAYVIDSITKKQTLIGVTSRGTERRGLCNQQAIYSSVMAYSTWITESLKAIAK